jgi:predicted RNA-binding Zn-ribbon protein involved in translation (DUF1610 family)
MGQTLTASRRPAAPSATPPRVAAAVAALQVRFSCPGCGKRCYRSRKDARKAASLLYPGKHSGKYLCGEYWHITSWPERQKGTGAAPARGRPGQVRTAPAAA